MRIVVHGQQAFGKAVLEALLKRGENVVAVYVAPTKPGAKADPLPAAAMAAATSTCFRGSDIGNSLETDDVCPLLRKVGSAALQDVKKFSGTDTKTPGGVTRAQVAAPSYRSRCRAIGGFFAK